MTTNAPSKIGGRAAWTAKELLDNPHWGLKLSEEERTMRADLREGKRREVKDSRSYPGLPTMYAIIRCKHLSS